VDLRATVDHVQRRPGMWFGRSDPTYDECAAFLLGWDRATNGVALDGFREWLLSRAGQRSSNLAWAGLVPVVVLGDDRTRDLGPEEHARLVEGFWSLVEEFLDERDGAT
jgi:hypothetical protein